jgi:Ca2+-binding RTX toxin-like protein
VVNERLGGVDQGGVDQVRSYVDYTLGADIENLILWADADIDGTGNSRNNVVQGNTGNNRLRGGSGNDSVLGDEGDDEVHGDAGHDQVYGAAGNDTLFGGSGNDELYGEDGADSLVGGAGDDTLEGGAGADTMAGGLGDDSYVVTEFTDVVIEEAGEGRDTVRVAFNFDIGAGSHIEVLNTTDQSGTAAINLYASDMANEIRGNQGANALYARGGDDFVQGFGGADTLVGGAGTDTLFGGTGDDSLRGEAGDDSLQGEEGADSLDGGIGQDSLYGGLGRDTLRGGSGDDQLYGEASDDLLYGEDGDDTLEGGAGDDTLRGGAGNDTYVVTEAGDVVLEAAGEGRDTLRAAVSFQAEAGAEIEVLNTTDQAGSAAIDLFGTDIDNEIRGNQGANTLVGRGGDDFMQGFGGHDLLSGDAGRDTLFGGSGNDSLRGYGDDDSLEGEGGDDSLEGGLGQDTLFGGAGFDTLAGGAGHDRLSGDEAADLLSGEAGDDTLFGGEGDDTLAGGDGADALQGDAGDDSLAGGAGHDTLDGGAGADSLAGEEGNDSLAGGAGRDTLAGGADNDILYGGLEDDRLEGGAGDDTLRGDEGADTLLGGAGNDMLYTGSGPGGRAEGGLGDDLYVIESAGVAIVEAAGGGHDVLRAGVSIRLDAGAEIEELRAHDLAGSAALDFTGSDSAQVIRGNAGANRLDGGGGDDTLFGYGGDDLFVIRSAGDRFVESAGNGHDTVLSAVSLSLSSVQEIEVLAALDPGAEAGLTLVGNDGAQSLTGDGGANFLNGKGGDDTLIGGAGNDTILGGAGTDTAVFAIASTAVGISVGASSALLTLGTGTQSVSDDVEVFRFTDRSLSFAELRALSGQGFTGSPGLLSGGAAGDTLIGTAGAERLSAAGGDDALFGGGGDDTLEGGAGDDSLRGGSGDDTLVGGAGTDTAVFAGASGDYGASAAAGGGLRLTGPEGQDLIGADVEFLRFDDRLLSFAEAAALVGATPVITGTGTNVAGSAATEIINGTAGNNWITPGGGSDTVDGGAGSDMVSFVDLPDTPGRSNTDYRLDIDLSAGSAVSHDGSEQVVLRHVERVTGSIYADRIKGDAGDNALRGMGDYDWFIATEGRDTIDGGTGQDMLSFLDYQSSASNVIADVFSSNGLPPAGAQASGVVVDLQMPANNTGLAAGLTLLSVERITGSARQDVFYGDAGQNDFRGLGDYDWFVSSEGGRERYFGGDGLDTVTYFNAASGVIASLSNGAVVNGRETGYGSGGVAARDLYFEIENLVGSRFGDTLRGSSERNQLNGLEGDDLIFGYGGVDYLKGGLGNDTIHGGAGSDYALFDGLAAGYTLTRGSGAASGQVTVSGADGTDILTDVEYFRFDDQDITIWSL